MAITLTYQPEDIMFLRNKQMIFGLSDLPLYEGGAKALIQFLFIAQGFEPDAQFSINTDNSDTLLVEYTAKASPSAAGEFQSWTGFTGTLQQYIDQVFLPILQGIPFISQNFNVYTTTFGFGIYVTIQAKVLGAAYTCTAQTNGSVKVITEDWLSYIVNRTAGADQTYNTNFYVSCDIYKRTFLSDNQEDWTLLAQLREYPDIEGNFQFQVGETCFRSMEPGLLVEGMPDSFRHTDRQPAKFRFVIYENDPDLETTPVATIAYASGILGGLPEPVNTMRDISGYHDNSWPRKLLTNAPRELAVPPDFAFIISAWHINRAPSLTEPILHIRPYDRDGLPLAATTDDATYIDAPVFGDISLDALTIWGMLKKREEDLHALAEFPAFFTMWFSAIDATEEEITNATEIFTLHIDPHRHAQVNYFIFLNALGATEICWTYGPLSAASQPDGEEFLQNHHTSQAMFQSYPGSGAQAYSGNADVITPLTCNTGLKPFAEIQWMLEMIHSPVVYWMTREGLRQWRTDEAIDPSSRKNRQYFQPVLIKKDSVDFYKSDDGRHNMQFSFTLAHSGPVPPILTPIA